MFCYLFFCVLVLVQNTCGVPASPNDILLNDVINLKQWVLNLGSTLGKWETVYATAVEPRLSSYTLSLSNIDNHVKSLEEKSHLWNNFQHHVATWNDQLSSSDRKLDIISKGQENLLLLENKLSTTETTFEIKLDTLIEKTEHNSETLALIMKKLEDGNKGQDTLFSDFTARGVLSTVKQIEKKIDRLLINSQTILKQAKPQTEDIKSKLTIKCNTPPAIEELLTDVSYKIDIIFDKFNKYVLNENGDTNENEESDHKSLEDIEEVSMEIQTDEQQSAAKVTRAINQQEDTKLLRKLLKRLNEPCNEFNEKIETIQNSLVILQNITSSIQETQSVLNQNSGVENIYAKIELQHLQIMKTLQDIYLFLHKFNVSGYNMMESNIFKQETISQYPSEEQSTPYTYTHQNISNHIIEYLMQNVKNLSCDSLKNRNSQINVFENDVLNKQARLCIFRNEKMWTAIQSRGNFLSKPENFSQNWLNYKFGFGDYQNEFWFGNEYIYQLTKEGDYTLRIELEDFDGNFAYAEYSKFKLESEDNNYKLHIGLYVGNASDSLSSHNGSYFSTFDRNNDNAPACCPCAITYGGGWWFDSCFESNLNGIYYKTPVNNQFFKGIIWEHWLGNYSLKKTLMMIRKDTFSASYENDEHGYIPNFEDP